MKKHPPPPAPQIFAAEFGTTARAISKALSISAVLMPEARVFLAAHSSLMDLLA